jgi:hypothetical protein
MSADDQHFTFNELSNDDKELLLANGYKPGELEPEDEIEIIRDLREQQDDVDDDSERTGIIADERDGTR